MFNETVTAYKITAVENFMCAVQSLFELVINVEQQSLIMPMVLNLARGSLILCIIWAVRIKWAFFTNFDTLKGQRNPLNISAIVNYKFFSSKSFTIQNCFYPGSPPDSILFARETSSDQTSNCHFRRPMTPQRTFPVWTPILMSTSVCVTSRTVLE